MDDRKGTPEPLNEVELIRGALSRATKGDIDEDLTISLRVAGGGPAQRYHFEFTTLGTTLMRSEVDCRLSERSGAAQGLHVGEKLVPSLSRRLLSSGLLEVPAGSPRFLPDTLVGILEIRAGTATLRRYFAADPDQAAVQDVPTPEPVRTAAEAIYDAAETLLDVDSVRP